MAVLKVKAHGGEAGVAFVLYEGKERFEYKSGADGQFEIPPEHQDHSAAIDTYCRAVEKQREVVAQREAEARQAQHQAQAFDRMADAIEGQAAGRTADAKAIVSAVMESLAKAGMLRMPAAEGDDSLVSGKTPAKPKATGKLDADSAA